ncbi:MAG: ankyrin repeat domain-containing protein [Gammaproteobacteria bacterium]
MSLERKDDRAPDPVVALMQHQHLKVSSNGVCHGLSYLAANAIALEQVKSYKKRIETIYDAAFFGKFTQIQFAKDQASKEAQKDIYAEVKTEDSNASFETWYQTLDHTARLQIQEKINTKTKEKISQTYDEAALLQYEDMQIFLQSASALQLPFQLTDYFPAGKAPIAQDSLTAMSLVMPVALEKQGGLVEASQTMGVYSEKKLAMYFTYLEEAIKKNKAFPMSFILEGANHTITVGYMPNEKPQWIVINPGAFPKFSPVDNMQALAKAVMASFPENEKVVLVNRVIVANVHKIQATVMINTWLDSKGQGILASSMKDIQKITPKKAKHIDHQGGSLLFFAAQEGNLEKTHELLKLGADPNSDPKNKNKKLPLAIAIFSQRTSVVKMLLEHNADAGKELDDTGEKPIYLAAKIGNAAIVELLLEHKANPNEGFGKNLNTPLHVAALLGHNDSVEKLINHKANLNAKNKSGDSVLDFAIKAARVSTVELLLTHGAEFSRASYAIVQTALSAEKDSTRRESLTKIKSLLESAVPALKGASQSTPKKEEDANLDITPKRMSR